MIKAYFQSFNIFSDKEINEYVKLFEIKSLKKNDFFAVADQRCDEVALIVNGIFRSFYITADGKAVTYCFGFPGELIASYASFITDRPSTEHIQAIVDAELLVISKAKIQVLNDESHHWTKFLKAIAEKQYLMLEERVFQLQKDTALERYKSLLRHQPEYIQQLPLQYLASYLGITQRHLSRIRNDISF